MECMPNEHSHADDHYVGCCLEKRLGIVAWDTRDAMGGERFHVFPPPICTEYRLPQNIEKAVREDYYYAYVPCRAVACCGCGVARRWCGRPAAGCTRATPTRMHTRTRAHSQPSSH